MTIYYKATRPDGTDFYSGRMAYVVGETVAHPAARAMEPNSPRTYISVSVEPAETLIGGRWPCRLFEVRPVGKTVERTDGRYPYKRGCKKLKVVREVEAWRALGPNGAKVADVITRTATLTFTEAEQLGAARDAAWVAARDAAWVAARDAAWVAARGAARVAAWDAARDAAWDAARDAALALVAQDLITAEQFDVLAGPWQTVIASLR